MISLISVMALSEISAQTNDTLRNIELPAALIRDTKQQTPDEKTPRIADKNLTKRINQGQDLPFLLNNLSSVVVSSDAGTGIGYTGIRVRGSDITRINVTMNGVPVNDPESQATFFVNTPDLASSATQIELQKGVGQSRNGNASFGASLSINTLDLDYERPYFSFHSDYGSFNTFKNTLKASTGLIQQKFVATVRASSILSDGFIDRSASDLKALQISTKYLVDKNTQVVFNFMRGREKTGQAWNGVPQDSLESNPQYNELGIKSDGTFYDNQTDNYGQDYYQLFVDHRLNTRWSVGSTLFYTKGKGYYEEYRLGQSFSRYGLPAFTLGADTLLETDLIRQLWLDNDFYGGRIYTTYISPKLDAGLYLNYNQYDGKHFGDVIWAQYGIPDHYRWYNLDASKKDFNVYAMSEIRLGKGLTLLGDVQYRKVNYQLNGFRNNPDIRHDLHWQFINPKLSVNWKHHSHQFALTAGLAQKEPNRDDIEAGVLSLPKPEKLYNTELTYRFIPNRKIALYVNAYLMYYRDQLILTGKINDVGAYTRTNVPESARLGIEFESVFRGGSWLEGSINFSLSRNKITSFTEYIDDYDQGGQISRNYEGTDIAFSPALVAGGRLSFFPFRHMGQFAFRQTSLDILPKFVSRQYLDNTQQLSRSIPSFLVFDLIANAPLKLKDKQFLTLRFGVQNLGNLRYASNGYSFSYLYNQNLITQNYLYPQAGRRWTIGLGIELQ
jgi:iron complex outermembrane receptor protein